MTNPLVTDDDSDLAAWQSGSQEQFLELISAEVRRFCGWHIAPNIEVAGKDCWIGGGGLVLLGSTHVEEIQQVVLGGQELTAGEDFTWDAPKGWLRLHPHVIPHPHIQHVTVSFVSGFESTPLPVKSVIFEVLATATELPASNASLIETTQYRFNLKDTVGVELSDGQKERLGPYRLRSFGGRVRP